MSTGFLNQGNAAFLDERYKEALDSFSEAIAAGAGAAGYSARAQTHLKMGNFVEAAQDAGKAMELEPQSTTAHFRKGKALFFMEEYEEAKKCFQSGTKITSSSEECELWIRKCDAEIAQEEENGGEASKTVTVSPMVPTPVVEAKPQAVTSTPARPKYRHQWYQTQTHCSVSLFAKQMQADRLTIHFETRLLRIQTRDENGGADFEFESHLSEEIVPSESNFQILKSKVEINMKKAIDGRAWSCLGQETVLPHQDDLVHYPTSAKRVIDWNKVESEVKHEEETEKEEGDAAVQKLFQKIYADADDDTRRAMMKSFQESKGTCLSTDWSSVGSKEVLPASRD